MKIVAFSKFEQGKEITLQEAAADMELTLQLLKNKLSQHALISHVDALRMRMLIDQSLETYRSTFR